jgi:hypothetical protein
VDHFIIKTFFNQAKSLCGALRTPGLEISFALSDDFETHEPYHAGCRGGQADNLFPFLYGNGNILFGGRAETGFCQNHAIGGRRIFVERLSTLTEDQTPHRPLKGRNRREVALQG